MTSKDNVCEDDVTYPHRGSSGSNSVCPTRVSVISDRVIPTEEEEGCNNH